MKRKDDWQQHLTEYIEAHRDTVFEWGKSDCCIFAAGAVEVMTGENPMKSFTVKYSDEKTGRSLMGRYGGLARILTDMFGHSHQRGQRGDVAYCDFPDGSAVGIHIGNKAVFLSTDGMVEVDLKDCKFFKVT